MRVINQFHFYATLELFLCEILHHSVSVAIKRIKLFTLTRLNGGLRITVRLKITS